MYSSRTVGPRFFKSWRSLIALILNLAAAPIAAGDDTATARSDSQIMRILTTRCVKCHGGGKLEGGLDLRGDLTILKGGDSGPAMVPGNPEESLLVQRIESGEMPPGAKDQLDDSDRQAIRRWVRDRERAPATPAVSQESPADHMESTLSEADRRFWAFQPPKRPEIPRVRDTESIHSPIDAFLLERLESRGLSFNPEAPREVLLRRLSFDLLGLPPTIEQQERFLRDDRPGAYERLVDRLLASPAYGERWGRHWLDIAGYADSDGGLAADRMRPQAWRYRDYVIQAFNRDLPFDQFLTEQIAGDELSDWRGASSLSSDMIRQLTATGFLRNASDPTYPGYTEANEIHQVLSDTMQIVGSSFLGITLQCARCHAHKFDPISQRDYYAFQAIFLPALDPARWQPSEVRGIPMATDGQVARLRAENQRIAERVKSLEAKLAVLTERHRRRWIDEILAGQPIAIEPALRAALTLAPEKRTAEQTLLLRKLGPRALKIDESTLAVHDATYKKDSEAIKARIAAEQAQRKPDPTLLRALTDLPGVAPQGRIMKRGDYSKPGATVPPDVPAVLTAAGYHPPLPAGKSSTGRRLALARWLTAPEHPLTARVQVNRIWAHHFGRGLVATTANFGHSGAQPSHPELLDWLATEFVRSGWSMKAMHRLMVTSTTYRQSSQADARKQNLDPENALLSRWRPRRLEGEVVRDSILTVAGSFNSAPFGTPVSVAAHDDGSIETADDAQANRRTIYLVVRRSQHLTLLDLFDTPRMELNCPERVVSTVPLQALALLHGPFAERNAARLADRIRAAADDPRGRLTYAFKVLFAREPTPHEIATISRFQESLIGPLKPDGSPTRKIQYALAERAAWVQTALVLLNSNEFVYVN